MRKDLERASVVPLQNRSESAIEKFWEGSEDCESFSETVLAEIRQAIKEMPGMAKTLGPLVGRIRGAQNAYRKKPNWVPLLHGHLAIGHRPKINALPIIKMNGGTHVVTLLSESEGGKAIGVGVEKTGLGWEWFPMPTASIPDETFLPQIKKLFIRLDAFLQDGAKIFMHCSAGIHRTGMMTFGLLRHLRYSEEEAWKTLRLLRRETAENVGGHRIAWTHQLGVR